VTNDINQKEAAIYDNTLRHQEVRNKLDEADFQVAADGERISDHYEKSLDDV
jgi:hypothetical protein